MNLGPFANCRTFFESTIGRPQVAGISGGATSGMMAALCDKQTILSFQNTSKEHDRTYAFLDELADALGREITWLQFVPPARRGAPPREARIEVVNSRTADRSGRVFDEMLASLEAFRATKGLGPIAPWARSRICTAYLKSRTQAHWLTSLGLTVRDDCSGLRRDEPLRVERWVSSGTRAVRHLAPLFAAGITKEIVAEFWSMQSFRLGLEAHLGNCTGCFLKDQADLSRSLDEVGDVVYWQWLANRYPGFGGKNFAGYEKLAGEATLRRQIEASLRLGKPPANDGSMDPRRFHLVVIQERKRIKGEVVPFSCGCEGSDTLAAMDDEQEAQYVLNLPSAEAA